MVAVRVHGSCCCSGSGNKAESQSSVSQSVSQPVNPLDDLQFAT